MKNNKSFYTNVRQWGNNILYVGYDNEGKRIVEKTDFKPEFFVPCEEDSKHKTIHGTNLRKVNKDSVRDAKDFMKSMGASSNSNMHGSDRYCNQLIKSLYDKRDVIHDISIIRIAAIDIEVSSLNMFPKPENPTEEFTCLTYIQKWSNRIDVWVNKEYGAFSSEKLKHIKPEDLKNYEVFYHVYKNERDMLRSFVTYFSCNTCDILTGWYSNFFDVPYLYARLKLLFGDSFAKMLSPWKIVQERKKKVKTWSGLKEETTYDIYGISCIDYKDLYQKYSMTKRPTYALDYISKVHLGKGKLEYEGTLSDLLRNDFQTYVEYNIIDTLRVLELDEELNFLDLLLTVAYFAKAPQFEEALGTVKYWETLIYHYLSSNNIHAPMKRMGRTDDVEYEGGYVKDTKNGFSDWVISFDLQSLYPSLIRQMNVGIETKVDIDKIENCNVSTLLEDKTKFKEQMKALDYSLGVNGVCYTRDNQSFISKLTEQLFNMRLDYRAQLKIAKVKNEKESCEELCNTIRRLDTIQWAIKIVLNSLYGALANKNFQFYDVYNAEAITLTGQFVIRSIANHINEYLNGILKTTSKDYIIAVDTDSNYIELNDLVNKVCGENASDETKLNFVDRFGEEKLKPAIAECLDGIYENLNHKQNVLKMNRENIASTAFWTGKKRYAMRVLDKEGFRTDELKVTGLETVRSSTPDSVKPALENIISIVLAKNEQGLQDFVSEFKTKFMKLEVEEISTPRSVSDVDKWLDTDGRTSKSGTPIHVNGSITYNNKLKDMNLDNTYDTIKNSDKILFTYLKPQNPMFSHVLSYRDKLPKEFEIEKYVDYDVQFDKTFLDPVKGICNAVGWKAEYSNDLGELFN